MTSQRANRPIPATEQFDFIYGRYSLSRSKIPYFATTLSLRQAAEALKLVNDFPGVESLEWKLEELYQRDIDWPRVENSIVPYLRDPAKPQFFNSLTVALLPILGEKLLPDFGEPGFQAPELIKPERFSKQLTLGPISLGYWDAWESITEPAARLGQIRWNKSQVFGVAIDGQHRLAAIKRIAQQLSLGGRADETQIPIILLILDPIFGYSVDPPQPLLGILRTLFIDLNKHAIKVSRAREILLDDNDPFSRCVRCLCGERIVHGLAELALQPPRLPLSLVDWHSEQAKFDRGPYIATTLGLDWTVCTVLGSKTLRDPTDYMAVRKQIRDISKALSLPMSDPKSPIMRQVDEVEELETPFRYSPSQLVEIDDAFLRTWQPALVHVLTRLTPYASLIDSREAKGSLTVEFVNWYYLYSRKLEDRGNGTATAEYKQLTARLAARTPPISERRLLEQLQEIEAQKANNLAFMVVFQRALILAFKEFTRLFVGLGTEDEGSDIDVLEGDESEEATPEPGAAGDPPDRIMLAARLFVQTLNEFFARSNALALDCGFEVGKREHKLWLGSILGAFGEIDFTARAAKSAQEILFWPPTLALWQERHGGSTFKHLWDGVANDDELVSKRLRQSFGRYYRDESSAAARILSAADREHNEDEAREECRRRVQFVWDKMQNK